VELIAMSEMLSIIVNTLGGSGDPYYLVERNGAWQDFGCGTPLKPLKEMRREYNDLLQMVNVVTARNIDDPARQTDVYQMLYGMCSALYQQMLPDALQKLLQKAACGAEAPGVRLHLAQAFDWVPWELMRDPVGYLGLRFVISRVPIDKTLPVLDEVKTKDVKRVRNLLGRDVISNNPALLAEWQTTFEPPNTVQYLYMPNGGGEYPKNDVVNDMDTHDIFHLTCHGAWDPKGNRYYWTLDPGQMGLGFISGISEFNFLNLALPEGRPLVFANACAEVGDVDAMFTGFGRELFKRGAQNVISTFAKVSRPVAIPFAKEFYQQLLVENKSIGRALLDTKRKINAAGAQDPSHLFYCLYGPPGTRFQYV
jgi:hypothetical protein